MKFHTQQLASTVTLTTLHCRTTLVPQDGEYSNCRIHRMATLSPSAIRGRRYK